MNQSSSLAGQRILIVEDEYLVAFDMAFALKTLGAQVIGPVPTVAAALELIEDDLPDCAILDVNLRGEMVYPLADRLVALGVPVLFATAYDATVLPERFRSLPSCTKPVCTAKLEALLACSFMPAKLSLA